LLPWTWA